MREPLSPDSVQHSRSPAPPASISTHAFRFTASGSEYFRIWAVNLLLSIATLGIYSAWAKVRRTQYFYQNTLLDGASFDYHGNPLAILKGRIIAVALLAAYHFGVPASSAFGTVLLIAAAALVPWLLWKSLQFKRFNSSHRGIRFGFRGTPAQVYTVFLLWPVAAVASGYLLAPFAHQRIKRFQHAESRYGTTYFEFDGKVSSFYKVYLAAMLIALASLFVISLVFGTAIAALMGRAGTGPGFGSAVLMMIVVYAGLVVLFQAVATILQNLAWNSTSLGPHRFASRMKWQTVAWITITNLVGIMVTLGLYLPFATVRIMRYRIESMSLLVEGSLDAFVAGSIDSVNATGEGAADLLDFDISL